MCTQTQILLKIKERILKIVIWPSVFSLKKNATIQIAFTAKGVTEKPLTNNPSP
jgi:hypothetical protein